jgi:hypothetical protein
MGITFELGARGRVASGDDLTLDWFTDLYDTHNENDILFVSSRPLIASGYFKNAGCHPGHRRRGRAAGQPAAPRLPRQLRLYCDPTGNGAFQKFSGPRFYTPAEPFGCWAGAQLRF